MSKENLTDKETTEVVEYLENNHDIFLSHKFVKELSKANIEIKTFFKAMFVELLTLKTDNESVNKFLNLLNK